MMIRCFVVARDDGRPAAVVMAAARQVGLFTGNGAVERLPEWRLIIAIVFKVRECFWSAGVRPIPMVRVFVFV